MLRAVALLAAVSAGCVIPGLDEDGKECPCALADGYVCEEATQKCVHTLPDASVNYDLTRPADSGTLDAGATLFTVDGEQILLAPGWSATLFSNFSSAYKYDPSDFDDSETSPPNSEIVDNHPTAIAPLVAPFTEGFAVLLGREILVIGDSGAPSTFMLKDFTPSAPNSGVCKSNAAWPCLDIPHHLDFAIATASTPTVRLLTSSNSLGNGDGVVQIDSTWTPSMLVSGNNLNTVYFDAAGAGGVGAFDPPQIGPQTYYAVEGSASPELSRFSGAKTTPTTTIIPNGTQGQGVDDVVVLADGNMAAVIFDDADLESLGVVTAKSGTYPVTMLQQTQTTSVHLASGDLARLPPGIFVINTPGTLVQLDEVSGAPTTLAQSSSLEWTWAAVTVPPATHALGKSGPVFYLLSSNRTASAQGIDHIIKLTPSF